MDGSWGRSGTVNATLLESLLSDPYFSLKPPKSTGREKFNLAWLQAHLAEKLSDEDIQATLVELTACSISQAIHDYAAESGELLVCGGGAHNGLLMERLAARLPQWHVGSTEEYGLAPRWVEATAFAWLARQTLLNLPGNLPSVTGATEESCSAPFIPAVKPVNGTRRQFALAFFLNIDLNDNRYRLDYQGQCHVFKKTVHRPSPRNGRAPKHINNNTGYSRRWTSNDPAYARLHSGRLSRNSQ